MRLKQLIDVFDMKWTKGNVIVNLGKLAWMQKHHAMNKINHGGPELETMIEAVITEVQTSQFRQL